MLGTVDIKLRPLHALRRGRLVFQNQHEVTRRSAAPFRMKRSANSDFERR
jgi:hypothetical protein